MSRLQRGVGSRWKAEDEERDPPMIGSGTAGAEPVHNAPNGPLPQNSDRFVAALAYLSFCGVQVCSFTAKALLPPFYWANPLFASLECIKLICSCLLDCWMVLNSLRLRSLNSASRLYCHIVVSLQLPCKAGLGKLCNWI